MRENSEIIIPRKFSNIRYITGDVYHVYNQYCTTLSEAVLYLTTCTVYHQFISSFGLDELLILHIMDISLSRHEVKYTSTSILVFLRTQH